MRLKILFVTPAPPFPPTDGARLLVYNLARGLSARHELRLLSFLPEGENEARARQQLTPWFSELQFVPLVRKARWREWAADAGDPLPLWVRVCSSPAFEDALRTAARAVDVVHLDTGLMAQYADATELVPTVLAPHDALTLMLEQQAQFGRDAMRRFWARQQIPKMRRYETQTYGRFTRLTVVTAREQNFLETLDSRLAPVVIPYGVDTTYYAPQPMPVESNRIGFLGAMDYPPNIAAVQYFAREVLPHIRSDIPDIKFTIIGRNPTPAVRALASDPHVCVTGSVEDVRPHLAQQALMVAPLRAAGGIKNKILEACAMGRAIVATPEAVEGLNVRDGQELVLASDAASFAQQCVRVLRDGGRRHNLEANARAWALTQTWEQIADAYELLYLAALNERINHAGLDRRA